MKLIKRLNPFGPASGAWRGPGSNELFHYSFSTNPALIFYREVVSTEVKKLVESNGKSYADFKEWYRAQAGSPRKTFNGSRFIWLFRAEHVWDYAFQKGFGLYPGPRLTADNKLVDENGNPWRSL